MSSRINQLKAAFAKQESTGGNNNTSPFFPFWGMKDEDKIRIRLLPDTNQDNPMGFLMEEKTHFIPLNGKKRPVPCLTMYGEKCPICKVSSDYYTAGDEDKGKKYYRSVKHIAQAMIIEDPEHGIKGDMTSNVGEVKLFKFTKQIFDRIFSAFSDDEMDEVPHAYENGTDFFIKKTMQGEYPSYTGSSFARKSTDLSSEVVELIEPKLKDLSSLLPPQPNIEEVERMLECSINDIEYSRDGGRTDDSESKAATIMSKVKKSTASVAAEEPKQSSASSEDTAQALIDQIRNRNS